MDEYKAIKGLEIYVKIIHFRYMSGQMAEKKSYWNNADMNVQQQLALLNGHYPVCCYCIMVNKSLKNNK